MVEYDIRMRRRKELRNTMTRETWYSIMKKSESKEQEEKMKRKMIGGVFVIAAVAIAAGLFVPNAVGKIKKEDVITSSELEKVINIGELSTAEFMYNGIAEKYSDDDPEKVECHIAYNASVKIGIEMDQVNFSVDDKKKTVKPELPEITVNAVTVDPDSLSYIPQNPKIEMKEIISLCKEDALTEAEETEELYQTAQENIQSAIEALLSPVLKKEGYKMQWQ